MGFSEISQWHSTSWTKALKVTRIKKYSNKKNQVSMSYRTILCPVDFSVYSIEALKHAMAIREKFDSRLVLLHVYQLPGTIADTGIDNEVIEVSLQKLRDFAVRQNAETAEMIVDATMGAVGDHIIAASGTVRADLIVMGSHGYSGIELLWLGSTSEYVLEHSKTPILIIRV